MTTIEIKEDLDDPKERARWVDKNAKKGQKTKFCMISKFLWMLRRAKAKRKQKEAEEALANKRTVN